MNHSFQKMFEEFSEEFGPLLMELIRFNNFSRIVEIGVACGTTTYYLCKGAEKNNGFVMGFDVWARHGKKNQFPPLSTKNDVEKYLTSKGVKNFTMTQVDTKSEQFKTIVKNIKPNIEFAFIDGDHSYDGVKNDFECIYPLLSKNGIIVFHDTLRIDGCREFMIDLRTKYNDGTFDIIDFPWGNGARRVGISVLAKRIFKYTDLKIDEICFSPSTPEQIYKKEKDYYG